MLGQMTSNKLTDEELNILRNVSIHSIVGIQNNGRRVVISCPHGNRDSNPSCVIYPDNSYHCFSCGKHGNNALDFMVDIEGDFIRALEELIKYVK